MGTRWVARVGTARVDFASKLNTRRTVCFVFTASGHLLTCHDDGLIEEAAAFDAMPLLQIRQIHAGTKAAVTLHDLTLQVLNETDIGALRDWLSSRRAGQAKR